MSSKYYRRIAVAPPSRYATKAGGYWGQVAAARAHANRPTVRWRTAVATVVEPLLLAIIALLLWGVIGDKPLPLTIGAGLSFAVVVLVLATLVITACASATETWRYDGDR